MGIASFGRIRNSDSRRWIHAIDPWDQAGPSPLFYRSLPGVAIEAAGYQPNQQTERSLA
jgi:hypothetical protein